MVAVGAIYFNGSKIRPGEQPASLLARQVQGALLNATVVGLTPDTGERQRGRSQESHIHGREECISQLDGQTPVAGLRLITQLDSTATTVDLEFLHDLGTRTTWLVWTIL